MEQESEEGADSVGGAALLVLLFRLSRRLVSPLPRLAPAGRLSDQRARARSSVALAQHISKHQNLSFTTQQQETKRHLDFRMRIRIDGDNVNFLVKSVTNFIISIEGLGAQTFNVQGNVTEVRLYMLVGLTLT